MNARRVARGLAVAAGVEAVILAAAIVWAVRRDRDNEWIVAAIIERALAGDQ